MREFPLVDWHGWKASSSAGNTAGTGRFESWVQKSESVLQRHDKKYAEKKRNYEATNRYECLH